MNDIAQPTTADAADLPPGCELIKGQLYMQNQRGELIPRESVKATDLLMDEAVRRILSFAVPLSAQVARFKQHALKDIYDYVGILAQEYGVARGGVKGNITLETFDGLQRVVLQVAERITFGPELAQAKALVDECLMEWSAESSAALRTIVQSAFNVDQKGHISATALLSLLRHDIGDERWQRAMGAIRDSIRPQGSKEYVRFYRRPDARSAWEAVTINVAAA